MEQVKIKNPILKGSRPDPSIVRAGDDYYIATSTFQWWPGMEIHHSKDLVNWELISRPLDRLSLLDMNGVPCSGGIWAPCLTYQDGLFYLIYTNVKERGSFMQTDNYLITTTDIQGPWSEPIYLNSMGFDPSLFHDLDGRKWLLGLDNHYTWGKRFNGLYLQEYCHQEKKLIGKRYRIYENPATGLVEGAHIYRRGYYYYLLKAQGGTGVNHSAQMARSKQLLGPYEDCPFMLLTSRNNPDLPLQKAGHADLVETPNGQWYMVHLTGSLLNGKSILGRETSIQKVEWTGDGWLKLCHGGHSPAVEIEAPQLPVAPFESKSGMYAFDCDILDIDFQTLRVPLSENELSLKARPGYLRLRGGAGLNTKFKQSLIARRLMSLSVKVTTHVEFDPENEKHMAGLIVYYDTAYWYYLYITKDDASGCKVLSIIKCDQGKLSYPLEKNVSLEKDVTLLRAEIEGEYLQFFYSEDGDFVSVGAPQDLSILSDEHVPLGFTGTFVGICCQDLERYEKCADFKWFEYVNREDV